MVEPITHGDFSKGGQNPPEPPANRPPRPRGSGSSEVWADENKQGLLEWYQLMGELYTWHVVADGPLKEGVLVYGTVFGWSVGGMAGMNTHLLPGCKFLPADMKTVRLEGSALYADPLTEEQPAREEER